MANNGILIEAGIPIGSTPKEYSATIKDIIGKSEAMKREGLIEAHRFYLPVTGNRTERAIALVLECTSAQMEPLVTSGPYIEVLTKLMCALPNFTTTRVVFGDILDRIADS